MVNLLTKNCFYNFLSEKQAVVASYHLYTIYQIHSRLGPRFHRTGEGLISIYFINELSQRCLHVFFTHSIHTDSILVIYVLQQDAHRFFTIRLKIKTPINWETN